MSIAGGAQAFWRQDGRELFYLSLDGKIISVDLKAGATVESGVPKVLPDGRKFLVLEPIETTSTPPITVVLDWTAAIPAQK